MRTAWRRLGRRIFQIDIGQNPSVTEAQARNIKFAANWTWNKLSNDMNHYMTTDNVNSYDVLAEAVHDYNASPTRHGGTMNQNLGGVAGLDRHTAGHNYVSNVLNMLNCFRLGQSMTGLPQFTF